MKAKPMKSDKKTQIYKILPDEDDHCGIEVKVNGKDQIIIIDIGSTVTIMPKNEALYKPEDIQPLKEIYQDVNKNEIKLLVKVWVNIEYNSGNTNLPH